MNKYKNNILNKIIVYFETIFGHACMDATKIDIFLFI